MRRLVLVLGDQLDHMAAPFDGFANDRDAVLMIEALGESRYVWSTKMRTAVFLSAMRHFRDELEAKGRRVLYHALTAKGAPESLIDLFRQSAEEHRPEEIVVTEPGEWRLREALLESANEIGCPLTILPDRHFMCSIAEFEAHAKGRKTMRMEFFYREMRKKYSVLMDGDAPAGGAWNFDKENRESFGNDGPETLWRPPSFSPDNLSRQVIQLVEAVFPDHPGSTDAFDWPVTRADALVALDDFIRHRLPLFGRHQDAMWDEEPFLFHSLLSCALNLKLLNPREVIEAAEKAHREDSVPLPAVEGFIRQILGWREYVRGIYWTRMPEYLDLNELDAQEDLPSFYWDGNTDMRCLQQVIDQTLQYGYAHHIQRLMVTGLFALLLGVHPRRVHEWYLAVYVDAVEWVELPNTLGMSQWADGGYMASKPYAATGKYIDRMSNYCPNCPYDPKKALGPKACPFTTLYWDFLHRHQRLLGANPRMALQVRNVERKGPAELRAIEQQAADLREQFRSSRPS